MNINAITLALLSTFTASAFAQDDMVVTASGYEQKLTHAPASVSVINDKELQEKNYTDLGQALSGAVKIVY